MSCHNVRRSSTPGVSHHWGQCPVTMSEGWARLGPHTIGDKVLSQCQKAEHPWNHTHHWGGFDFTRNKIWNSPGSSGTRSPRCVCLSSSSDAILLSSMLQNWQPSISRLFHYLWSPKAFPLCTQGFSLAFSHGSRVTKLSRWTPPPRWVAPPHRHSSHAHTPLHWLVFILWPTLTTYINFSKAVISW